MTSKNTKKNLKLSRCSSFPFLVDNKAKISLSITIIHYICKLYYKEILYHTYNRSMTAYPIFNIIDNFYRIKILLFCYIHVTTNILSIINQPIAIHWWTKWYKNNYTIKVIFNIWTRHIPDIFSLPIYQDSVTIEE